MKKTKLLRNIVLVLLPILLYYCVFVAFEPNNYFGIKKQADGTDIIAALREYEKNPQKNIILGDSRMAKFDLAIAQEASGTQYTNLSYGGASFKEQLDLVDWAMEIQPDLEEIVFGLSFYTLNQGYSHDRKVIDALNNPLAYMTNLGYNINMLTNLINHLTPNTDVGDKGETANPEEYEYAQFINPANGKAITLRKDIGEYLEEITPRTKDWQLNEAQFTRLLETIQTCEEKGIRFIVVFPPAHENVMKYVVRAYGVETPMLKCIAQLNEQPAVVLDYEFTNRPPLRDDQFFDGFHLDIERGLDEWTEILFNDIAKAA